MALLLHLFFSSCFRNSLLLLKSGFNYSSFRMFILRSLQDPVCPAVVHIKRISVALMRLLMLLPGTQTSLPHNNIGHSSALFYCAGYIRIFLFYFLHLFLRHSIFPSWKILIYFMITSSMMILFHIGSRIQALHLFYMYVMITIFVSKVIILHVVQ